MLRVSALTLSVALCAATSFGQARAVSGHASSAGTHGPITAGSGIPITRHGVTPGFSGFHVREGFRRPFRRGVYPYGPYWFPGYYADDFGLGYDSYEPPPPAQTVPQAAPPVSQQKQEPPPSPVLLELHGNQWVKVSSFTAEAPQLSNVGTRPEAAAKEMPPAILVFRDGHSEELTSYSIIGPVIYTKADYWNTGRWTREIQIASIDVPATIKQNRERGVNFELPSSPDEVMIRP